MELKFLELSYDDGGGSAVPYTREQARAIWAVQVGVGDDSSFLGTHPSIVSTTLRLPLAHFGGGAGGGWVVDTGAWRSIHTMGWESFLIFLSTSVFATYSWNINTIQYNEKWRENESGYYNF